MENSSGKWGRNLIIFIIVVFTALLFFGKALRTFESKQFLGLSYLQIANFILGLFLFSIFSFLGYKKAREKNQNPILWALICFIFNLWGYLFLLYYGKNESKTVENK